MAKVSQKQRDNIERYKKRGWKTQDIEKCRSGMHFNGAMHVGAVLPADFDPPAPERMSRTELSYLMDV
jgi:hypothetical protein